MVFWDLLFFNVCLYQVHTMMTHFYVHLPPHLLHCYKTNLTQVQESTQLAKRARFRVQPEPEPPSPRLSSASCSVRDHGSIQLHTSTPSTTGSGHGSRLGHLP